jgi:NhaP-type Na+/H+ or K+/H+ antiporter
MSQLPPNNAQVVEVKPQANIYTVLLLVSILALVVGIAFVAINLLGEAPNGYGMEFGELFKPVDPTGAK